MIRLGPTRSTLTSQPGLLMGALTGAIIALASSVAFVHRSAAQESAARLEVTHVPPLLRARGEPVELRYDVFCVDADEIGESSCDPVGTVFVRRDESGPFEPIPLRLDASAVEGRFVASVSAHEDESPNGLVYYATFTDPARGTTATLPAGGEAATQRSLLLTQPTRVELGRHGFGRPRPAAERVLRAPWGEAATSVGLERGRNLAPIGASSFDVDRAGNVSILDQVHRRVLRWRHGASAPAVIDVPIGQTLADIAVAPDGSFFVLESVARPGRAPLIRRFDGDGRELETVEVAERAAQIRMSPAGPLVLQHPSGQWMPVTRAGVPLGPNAQRRSGRTGRAVPGNREVVVLRHENEIRVALVGHDGLGNSWRVTSETPLAEVQVAEPLGHALVVVVRAYTEAAEEFIVLLLHDDGVVDRFAIPVSDWAETAPLARFRVAGTSLYQLGSTPEGVFVDRFDLEVK